MLPAAYTAHDILLHTAQRPYPVPAGRWVYYQEWHNVLFMHFRADAAWVQQQLPAPLTVDTCDGAAWLSVVAFEVHQLRPRGLPRFSPLSHFKEVNVRTYALHDGRPGVYFLNIAASKRLLSTVARTISGLPYRYAPFAYQPGSLAGPDVSLQYSTGAPLPAKTATDLWLTERYCLYNAVRNHCYRYDIHHVEWPVHTAQVANLRFHPSFASRFRLGTPDCVHFSTGVQVLAWPAVRI